ncbi:hypothetical protein [Methylovulum psychrotolerans]|uniref:hypothetical protein n=1 Tax=Methylovulum psychrotolerans TaxID=1704499 RepID=UPI0012FA8CEC|nr:hypothetical protein [Methylovulum psychrotolerans]
MAGVARTTAKRWMSGTDLNPIEHKWAQLKSIRNQARCSVDDLFTGAVTGHLFISD